MLGIGKKWDDKEWIMSVFGKAFLFVVVISIAILIGVTMAVRAVSPEAITALLGVLIGGSITSFVQYTMSEATRKQQLQLAALDKRLQAHQDAFTLWHRLIFANRRDNEEFAEVVQQCQDWWQSNCLYLTAEARSAFRKAYLSAVDHNNLVNMHGDSKLIIAAWEDMERAGKIIVEGVGLPSLGDETNKVKKDSKSGNA
jgi:hypothetical protein